MKTRIILLLILALIAANQVNGQKSNKKIAVTGTVVDIKNQPVSGAMIFIDERLSNAVSNSKGIFKIKVKPGTKMIEAFTYDRGSGEISFKGVDSVLIIVDTSFVSRVKPPRKYGDEEVNVGYGTTKKKDLTTNINQVNAQQSRYASYSNIYEILSEVPGVQVSGRNVLIRGINSLNSDTGPLYVVDGVVVSSLDYISPKDVKRISVLKGAEAAIYGSRASGGVILIETIGAGK